MTEPDEPPPDEDEAEELDCTTCGKCCYSRYEYHVPVSGIDFERLTVDEQRRYTHWDENTCFMRMRHGHCIMLDARDGLYLCKIYDRRPEVCREFERGGASCDVERMKTLPMAD